MALVSPFETTYSTLESTLSTIKRRSGRPITFGVEIEAVLAFDQPKLQSVLDRFYPDSPQIIKSFPDSAHDSFLTEDDFSHTCRYLYPSWVLQVPLDSQVDKSLQLVGQQSTSITGLSGKVRTYLAEPLIIAREAIGDTRIPIDVKAQLRRNAERIFLGEKDSRESITLRAQSANYDRWTLTTDHTLIGCVQDQLHEVIGSKLFRQVVIRDSDGIVRVQQERHWDSSGFELISPVFKYSDRFTAFSSITQCLGKLSKGPSHQIMTSTWASLQVHVGLDCQNRFDISVRLLQHLAYILLTHEELISRLHPGGRSGLYKRSTQTEILCSDATYIDDLEDFDPEGELPPEKTPSEIAAEDEAYLRRNDEIVVQAEANYTGYKTTNSNLRYFCHTTSTTYPPSGEEIASQIFQVGMTIPKLISLLQKPSTNIDDAAKGHRYRGYMYNFDNILTMYLEDGNAWKTGKPTIEFRQHACSVDPVEIRRWVELCFAIVKFAQKMADQEEQEGRRYDTSWPCGTIQQFLGKDYVGLTEEEIEFWKQRFERYKDDRPGEKDIDSSMM